jgi:hypothetical protein
MNTAAKISTVGVGLLAGATLGMGPAQAAPPTGQAATSSSVDQQQNRQYDDEVVGYFRNYWRCDRAGRFGEHRGAWDDYDCMRVRWGFHRGHWALVVEDNNWNDGWGDHWRPGHWPNNWPNRPQWGGGGHWNGSGGDDGHWNGGGGHNGDGHDGDGHDGGGHDGGGHGGYR